MRVVLFCFLVLFSLQGFPGDKGNLAREILDLDSSTLVTLMDMTFEVEDEFYTPLAEKNVTEAEALAVLEDAKISGKFFSLIIELKKRNEKEMLEALIFDNEMFYEAFSVSGLENGQQKDAILAKYATFWADASDILEGQLGYEQAQEILSNIDSGRLGYNIQGDILP